MDRKKRPRQQGGRQGGASWSRQKKAKSRPELPRSLMKELGYQQKDEDTSTKKTSSDQKTSRSSSASKARAKQPGDPLSRSSQDGVDAELQLQATLAKKLKLKQGSKRTGPEDGLDELLKGIEDLNGTVPTGSLPQLPDSDEEDPLLNDEAELALQDSEEDDSEEEESLDSDGMEALDDDGQLLQEVDDDDDEVAVDFGDDGGDELGPNEHGGSARGTGASSSDDDEEDGELHEGGGALMPAGGQQGREATAMNGVEGESDDEEGSDGSGEEPPQLVEAVQQGKRMPGLEAKYVPPAARKLATKAAAEDNTARPKSAAGVKEDRAVVQRKVRSLLNRVAVANLPRVASELAEMFNAAPRHIVAACIVDSIMQAVEEGPRAADQFAAVTSCVLVMTAVVANMQQLLANAVLALAQALQQARAGDDSIAASNITRIICFLYSCNGLDHQLMYSLLGALQASFSDGDVQLMLLVLQTVGQQMRIAEPNSFKAFLERAESKMTALAAAKQLSQRSRLMLELIVEMKNSKKIKEKHGAGSLESNLNADVMQQLRSCSVERVAMHSLTWDHSCRIIQSCERLQLTSGELKGTWWLPHGAEKNSGAEGGTGRGSAGAAEADAVMQLAVKQRMNTDSRRAIFCILMSADDYMDAFERLLRLPLKGAADRDIAHVLVHCCLQEEKWNPYYALVAKQLMHVAKTYKTSMQFAIQDRLRHAHNLNARQAANLAEFLAYLLAHKALSLVVFKVLNMQQPTSRTTLFCRMCMQRLIRIPKTIDELQKIFGSLQQPRVRAEILGVIRHVVRPWAVSLPDGMEKDDLLNRTKTVESVLKAQASIPVQVNDEGEERVMLGEASSSDDEVDAAV